MRTKHPIPALVIGLMTSLVLTGCEAGKSDTEFLAEAKQSLAGKDFKSAVIHLKNAVGTNPTNAQARRLLGGALLATGQLTAAEKELRRAIDLGANRPELLADLSQVLLEKRRYIELLTETDERKGVPSSDLIRVELYRGLSELMLNRHNEAKQSFGAAVGGDAPYSILAQGYQALLSGQTEQAITLAHKLDSTPLALESQILIGRAQAESNQPEAAINTFKQVITSRPDRIEIYPQTILLQLNAGNTDGAEQTVDRLLQLAPNFDWALITKAMIRLNRKDWDAAVTNAEKAIALRSPDMRAKLISGMANFYLKNFETSAKHLRSISSSLPAGHTAHRLLAYIDTTTGKMESADSALNLFDGSNPNDARILSSLAGSLAKQGFSNQATTLLERGAELAPEDPTLLTRLGTLKLLQGQQGAEQDLNAALALNPQQPGARSALVRQLIKGEEFDKARQVAQQQLEQVPDSNEGYLLLAEVDYAQNRYEPALRQIQQGIEQFPGNFSLLMAAAKLSAASKDYSQTIAYLEQSLQVEPTDRLALINLYRAQKTVGDTQNAQALIKQTLKQHPDSSSAIFAAAIVEADQGDPATADQRLSQIGSDSDIYPLALSLRTNLAARQNDMNAATGHLEALSKLYPHKPDYIQRLVAMKVQAEALDSALLLTQQAQKSFPRHPWFQLAEIQLYMQTQQQQQALRRADAFTSQFGKSAALPTLLAAAYVKMGDHKEAVKYFDTAYQNKPDDGTAARLARALQLEGDWQQAVNTLNQRIDVSDNPVPLQILVAEILIAQPQQRDNAAHQYQQILERSPDNLVALNNLASILSGKKAYDQALPLAARAHKLQPGLAAIQDTYGYLLVNSGQLEKGLELLEQAYTQAGEDPAIAYHYAVALNQTGSKDAARQTLRQLSDKDFDEKPQAMALLKVLQ